MLLCTRSCRENKLHRHIIPQYYFCHPNYVFLCLLGQTTKTSEQIYCLTLSQPNVVQELLQNRSSLQNLKVLECRTARDFWRFKLCATGRNSQGPVIYYSLTNVILHVNLLQSSKCDFTCVDIKMNNLIHLFNHPHLAKLPFA